MDKAIVIREERRLTELQSCTNEVTKAVRTVLEWLKEFEKDTSFSQEQALQFVGCMRQLNTILEDVFSVLNHKGLIFPPLASQLPREGNASTSMPSATFSSVPDTLIDALRPAQKTLLDKERIQQQEAFSEMFACMKDIVLKGAQLIQATREGRKNNSDIIQKQFRAKLHSFLTHLKQIFKNQKTIVQLLLSPNSSSSSGPSPQGPTKPSSPNVLDSSPSSGTPSSKSSSSPASNSPSLSPLSSSKSDSKQTGGSTPKQPPSPRSASSQNETGNKSNHEDGHAKRLLKRNKLAKCSSVPSLRTADGQETDSDSSDVETPPLPSSSWINAQVETTSDRDQKKLALPETSSGKTNDDDDSLTRPSRIFYGLSVTGGGIQVHTRMEEIPRTEVDGSESGSENIGNNIASLFGMGGAEEPRSRLTQSTINKKLSDDDFVNMLFSFLGELESQRTGTIRRPPPARSQSSNSCKSVYGQPQSASAPTSPVQGEEPGSPRSKLPMSKLRLSMMHYRSDAELASTPSTSSSSSSPRFSVRRLSRAPDELPQSDDGSASPSPAASEVSLATKAASSGSSPADSPTKPRHRRRSITPKKGEKAKEEKSKDKAAKKSATVDKADTGTGGSTEGQVPSPKPGKGGKIRKLGRTLSFNNRKDTSS